MTATSKKIYVPTQGADSWKCLLAEPDKHWKTGFSARLLAHCWEDAKGGFPKSVNTALSAAGQTQELLLAIPEFKVNLPPYGAASQSDIFVLSRDDAGLTVMMVEGKVNESFDKKVGDWNDGDGKERRLLFLLTKLGLKDESVDAIRYQLLHRTVSALLTAEQFHQVVL
ncbi:hypothetical protein FACS189454_05420 [Planctomycetales bacterium]|nr:hypothetical protein FACS189454_05420 [Planctomycetales bacterium]